VADIVAITGATGFAGSHVVDLLDRQGRAMRLLVRRRPEAPRFKNADIIVGTLEDKDSLMRLVAGASAVVHIAGAIAAHDRAGFFAVNAEGTARLAQAALGAGVKRFISISSLAAREPELSDYGASKRAGEELLIGHGPAFDLTVLRPPVIYGPGDLASLPLIAQLTHRVAFLPGSPRSRFSLLYVEDFAAMVVRALEDGPRGIHEIDDGTGGGYAWPEIVKIAAESLGRGAVPIYLPRGLMLAVSGPAAMAARMSGRVAFFSPDKVRELYHADWVCRESPFTSTARVRFREGFARTVRWYGEQGWLRAPAFADRTRARSDKGELLS
jgi:nucleoside-diphosphate-sugar epimerase